MKKKLIIAIVAAAVLWAVFIPPASAGYGSTSWGSGSAHCHWSGGAVRCNGFVNDKSSNGCVRLQYRIMGQNGWRTARQSCHNGIVWWSRTFRVGQVPAYTWSLVDANGQRIYFTETH